MLSPQQHNRIASYADPEKLAHGLNLVSRYRGAIDTQHKRIFDAWSQNNYDAALVELHFLLIAIDRVTDGLQLIADSSEKRVANVINSKQFADYRDARNHFEHIEDRLYGSRKNAPEPIVDGGGGTRTIHYGLSEGRYFQWGAKRLDISAIFVKDFLEYTDSCVAAVYI